MLKSRKLLKMNKLRNGKRTWYEFIDDFFDFIDYLLFVVVFVVIIEVA